MPDTTPLTTLATLRRPRMLVSAARKGTVHYKRDRDLPRILSAAATPKGPITPLMGIEDRLEQTRKAGDVTYSIAAHIAVLTALLAEASLAASA